MEKVTIRMRVEAAAEILSALLYVTFGVVFFKTVLVVSYCVETTRDWWADMLDRYYYIKIDKG